MRTKRSFLIAAVVWFVTAAIWLTTFSINLCSGTAPAVLIVLQGLCVAGCLTVAIVNLVRYLRAGKQDEE